MVLATIRADTTVTSEMDYQCSSAMFALVCVEAATLILAGEHLVDFVDLNVSEVVFFRYTKRAPVVVVLEYVPDGERGIGEDAEEKCDDAYFRCEDVDIQQLDVGLGGNKNGLWGKRGVIVYIP